MQYMLALLAQFDNALPQLEVDGEFGAATTHAVRTYQQLVGLPPNGYVDETTWNSIFANFARAEYFFRREEARSQAREDRAVPAMGRSGQRGGTV